MRTDEYITPNNIIDFAKWSRLPACFLHLIRHPSPLIFFIFPAKIFLDGVSVNIIDYMEKFFSIPDNMIIRFRLPQYAGASHEFIDLVSGKTFDAVQEFRKIAIQQLKQEMHMVRHNHSRV